MESGTLITLVANGGSTAILLYILSRLWGEYRAQARYVRKKLDQADDERKVIIDHLGLTTQDLKAGVNRVRRARGLTEI